MRNPEDKLISDIRRYILVFSVGVSMFLYAIVRASIDSDDVFYIRIEQVYGFIGLGLLYLAVLISPLVATFRFGEMAKYLIGSRRAVGVSAAYYSLLHGGFALFGQLGGPSKLGLLPTSLQVSIYAGMIALAIMTFMMITSLDVAIRKMTVKYWSWLHRLVYVAVALVLVHVWLIGSHIGTGFVPVLIAALLSLLIMLESIRISKKMIAKRPQLAYWQALIIVCMFTLPTLAIIWTADNTESYSQKHQHEGEFELGGGHNH